MELTVRAATTAELPELMQLYTNARAFMQTHGNPTQWHAGYPGEARLAAEIERGVCHVVMGGGDHSGGVLPDTRRRPHLPLHRGRCLARGCTLRDDPPSGVSGARGRHRALVRAVVFTAGPAGTRRYPRRQHLYAAYAGSLRLCALRDNLHRGRHAKMGVLPLRNINNSAPHSRYMECGALLC